MWYPNHKQTLMASFKLSYDVEILEQFKEVYVHIYYIIIHISCYVPQEKLTVSSDTVAQANHRPP